MKTKFNLNDIEPVGDGGSPEFQEISCGHEAIVDVYFDFLETHLGVAIAEADMVVGCMAWLTNRHVLNRLAALRGGCQIIVQKEDFLRPGQVQRDELHALYSALTCPNRSYLPIRSAVGPEHLSYAGDPTCQPVRVMGIAHRRGENGPRMHHKFLVFCRGNEPYAVWTGSFNATENGSRSRENAVFIRSESLARKYCAEWSRTLALSEPLDWSSDYVDPEWRFGS